ncbi:uncharacterized protein LOC131548425 [Onychostoma macrolepis]|uniref:uncharacterized protein LOC131548425 n=1 Tax=Onychostoma macrolepis TaxID=369639 RepID=UPI00272D3F59|nr:uncharacterized protein LOC131548425 [Onychostoma macrolepis]
MMSLEVAADAAEPPEVVALTAVFPEVMVPAAVSPEVAVHAAEPPEAAVLTSAPRMVVAPSNELSACCVTVKETITELSLCPVFTTVEPPEVAATAAEPPEVSAVSANELSFCPVTAMEAINELSFCPVPAMETNYELPVFPTPVLVSVHVLSPPCVFVLHRSQALLWVPDPSWWAPALSAPPVLSAPLWWLKCRPPQFKEQDAVPEFDSRDSLGTPSIPDLVPPRINRALSCTSNGLLPTFSSAPLRVLLV